MGDRIRQRDDNNIAVLSAGAGEKITFLAVCGKNAVAAGIRAGDLVKNVSKICGGSGGGKPDSAMGGGKDPLKVDDALAAVDDFVAEKLGQ
jgi:alanyl-tRNA synthetase